MHVTLHPTSAASQPRALRSPEWMSTSHRLWITKGLNKLNSVTLGEMSHWHNPHADMPWLPWVRETMWIKGNRTGDQRAHIYNVSLCMITLKCYEGMFKWTASKSEGRESFHHGGRGGGGLITYCFCPPPILKLWGMSGILGPRFSKAGADPDWQLGPPVQINDNKYCL